MSTREEVKKVAIQMVKGSGLINLSRSELCRVAGIADGSFPHVMGCNFSEFITELKAETDNTATHVVSKSRANPELRKEQILTAALSVASDRGFNKMTRDHIAEAAGVSVGLVSKYFGTMPKLKRDVMRAAIRGEWMEIVAEGLATGDPHARKAPQELKEKAVALFATI
jgi:hypothetical protein